VRDYNRSYVDGAWVKSFDGKLFCAFFVLAILASSTVLTAQQHHYDRTEGGDGNAVLEKLGAVYMPISCAASVQTPFERGIALLHSFWYEELSSSFNPSPLPIHKVPWRSGPSL
jgi:hypothetical protein